MIPKNKKAIVLENTLSVIIAVLGLLLLIYSAYYLYNKMTSNIETESAKEIANLIEKKINALPDNQAANITIRGVNGDNWVLTSFDFSNQNRPDACFEQPCIYICKSASNSIENDCKKNGFFRRLNFDEILVHDYVMEDIKENNPLSDIYLGKEPKRKIYIYLPNKLIELKIEKTSTNKKILIIEHFSDDYTGSREPGGKFGGGGSESRY